jgi:hypothetical protein
MTILTVLGVLITGLVTAALVAAARATAAPARVRAQGSGRAAPKTRSGR